MTREVNFDGLVGQTHNYAGLSYGNVASLNNSGEAANPRKAALQGLAKMKAMMDSGLTQGVLPPHERPHLPTLRAMGFTGSDAEILKAAYAQDPVLLAACSSASCMWVANAATVSPSADTWDKRVHFTPANLHAKLHRCIEAEVTGRVLGAIFTDPGHFVHHPVLPRAGALGDEGAANHTRLALAHGAAGVEVFTYGHVAFDRSAPAPSKFPARQSAEASRLIARAHGLDPEYAVFVQQTPRAIDAGVFHNDVIAVGNERVLLIHEHAWLDQAEHLAHIDRLLEGQLCVVEIPEASVSIADAVTSYLFNSQIVTRPDGGMTLVAAMESRDNAAVSAAIDAFVAAESNPIDEVRYFDLTQSMRNGGGPACLRLRVALTDAELAALSGRCVLDDALHAELVAWVQKHYRDSVAAADLADPQLLTEVRTALDELTQILEIGAVYDFQRG